ncbi:hypothetical protein [Planobispora takensis]|uniref:DUF1579 domain-containing protein n=1 Tax=Planobispora takensis TaxID=1367882 RepID=A0A8J3SSZ4_9ACTN|nr:hypothetical protein [Planobispora takensis]GII00089.1 hypothetical protein Pta02_20970 [Planobispora takensis]
MTDTKDTAFTVGNSFDFLVGTWTSRQRRLRRVLAGDDEWYGFPGVTRCWSVLDGAGNIDDVYGGVPIKVNYIWSDITAHSCRWEQEFSADGGATWETNWIAEFTRTS